GDLDERLLGFLLAQDHVDLALELGATILVGGSGEDDELSRLSHAGHSPFSRWADSNSVLPDAEPLPRQPRARDQPLELFGGDPARDGEESAVRDRRELLDGNELRAHL